MRLTYNEALGTIIERTEIGYTLASQDKVWIVFTFDLDSEGEMATFRYNRLYPLLNTLTGEQVGWSYELLMMGGQDPRGVPVFTSRAEAEHYATELRAHLDDLYDTPKGRTEEKPSVYVMNLGDDARYEKTIIGPDGGARPRTTPKFTGSILAWRAMEEMTKRWRQENLPTSP